MEIEEAIKAMKEHKRTSEFVKENADFMIRMNMLAEDKTESFIRSEEEIIEGYETAIQALEKQKNNGWIPVSEKLPKANKHVLLFLKDIKGKTAQVVGFLYHVDDDDFRKQFNGEFAAFDGDYVVPAFLVKELVIAWQPLPEPYKEVEND